MRKQLNSLSRYLHEYIGDVTIGLCVIAVFLFARDAYDALSQNANLDKFKTISDIAKTTLGIILGLVGTLAAYRRYFKGRTFTERAVLTLTSQPICKLPAKKQGKTNGKPNESGDQGGLGSILHAVDVSIENISSLTIWEPQLSVRARRLDSEKEFEPFGIAEKIESPVAALSVPGIEPGETIHHHYRFQIPEGIPAFRVSAELKTKRGNIWHRSISVGNQMKAEGKDD